MQIGLHLGRVVTDLVEVRRIISRQVGDEELRTRLLHLAGAVPRAWKGCSVEDVVPVLKAELTAQGEKPMSSHIYMKGKSCHIFSPQSLFALISLLPHDRIKSTHSEQTDVVGQLLIWTSQNSVTPCITKPSTHPRAFCLGSSL